MNRTWLKLGLTAALCFSLPATQASADRLGAAIVGGIIGGVIVNEAHKNKRAAPTTTTRNVQPRNTVNTAARQQNRQVQTSLNYFGFPAGTADGVLGQRSRGAIAQYQAHLGFPATGQLTPYERDFLITSYSRAQIGGPQVIREMNTNPQGVKGLLVVWRDEALGVGGQQGGQMAATAAPAYPVAQMPAPTAQMAAAPTAAAATALGGIQPLPMMTAPATDAPSLASHCSKVSLLTNSNGGFVTLANLSDSDLALSEQFCLTRTYAIGKGEDMIAKVQGLTQAQVDQQCDAFGPALAPFTSMLDSADSATVRGEVQKFVLGSAMTADQLESTAEICLFTGYRRDRMEVALGSALLLVGIGKTPYAEMVGHHLAQGFGVTRSAARAQDWYAVAVNALSSGTAPVFAPGQPERVELLRTAATGLGGAQAMPQPQPAGLPAFKLD